ncbi:hypothetical protein B9T38_05460 [Acinetobacter sp. ANC 4218]|uniref:NADAR family protein n=1 Tax=Acinetobacter sp. ANC 4218 TaxID=1977880 RepID=UPI000A344251|nr:NADAR family protein [Acinetobacter sp. ANC 4218]OTG73063.1 hypothetical protein B9T38_05460 [Acinetobacter sp. ANC 4218]
MDKLAERIYDPDKDDLAIFRKTHEQWGGFSNMASGFPIRINDHILLSSEALYQALKFTDYPDIQKKIIAERSPMTAKMVAKPFKNMIRQDFENKKIIFMKWCVRAKLLNNYDKFSKILLASENKIIVEESRRDNFWGAKKLDNDRLIGINVLGRILIELREELKNNTLLEILGPIDVPEFYLYGEPIQPIKKLVVPPLSNTSPSIEDLFN